MTDISIALITPTINRPTLMRSLYSGLSDLRDDDEWWIIGDGSQPIAKSLVESLDDRRLKYLEYADPNSRYGNAQRNFAMQRATADYFLFLDDDDVLLPGALDCIRQEGQHNVPLMFRMDYRPRRCTLWKTRQVRKSNVGGTMFCVPNILGKWKPWTLAKNPGLSDLQFIQETLSLWPENSLRWCEQIICRCDRHNGGQPTEVVLSDGAKLHPSANVYNTFVGENTKVAAFAEVGGACLGRNCKIQAFAFIPPGVTLADDVFVGPHVCFTNDRVPKARKNWNPQATWVKQGASIGANATILSGITIGENAMIAAGATVVRDVANNETYFGK